jgi:hypothetical protein
MTNGDQSDKQADETRRAEQRMLQEIARQKREEEAHLKALKFGCIGVIVAIVLAMVLAFLF